MTITSSYIVFDSAPTLNQCKESLNRSETETSIESESHWNITKSKLDLTSTSKFPTSNSTTSKSHILPNPIHSKISKEIRKESSHSSRIISQEFSTRKEEEGNGIWSDIDDDHEGYSRDYQPSEEEIEEIVDESMDDITDNSIPFPQRHSQLLPGPTQFTNPINNDSNYSLLETQNSTTTEYPPTFQWKYKDLISFDKLHNLLTQKNYDSKPIYTSILGVVLSGNGPKSRGNKVIADWGLGDSTEMKLNVVMWNETGEKYWNQAIIGDIIWLGNVSAKIYQNQIQINLNERSSIQICYRTRPLQKEGGVEEGEEVNEYFWSEHHGENSDEAGAVIKLVKWFNQSRPRRFF